MRLSLIALLSASIFCMGAGKIYKWVDKDGRVHYSGQAPANSNAARVNIRAGTSAPAADTTATDTDKQDQAASGDKDAGKVKLTEEQIAKMRPYCNNLRSRIQQMSSGLRLLENGADGQQRELSRDEVSSKLREDQQNLDTYCTANGL
jgi:hypothetical protein